MISREQIIQSALATFDNEAKAVAALADTVNREEFARVVEHLATTQGHLHVTGCGTSGVAAKKVAQVFNCIGRPATYLNPADAPHGDYGIIRGGDTVIIITKSGHTREMEELLPIARLRGANILCVTENEASPVAQGSDFMLLLSTGPEACPYGCLSTTSVTAVLVIFDAIDIAIMLYNGIDERHFAAVHPGGGVGAMLQEKGEAP